MKKKTNTTAKSLLLSTERIRTLRPLDETELRAAAGGFPACPGSVVKVCDDSVC